MRIAVNARCFSNTNVGPGYYTAHLFDELVKQHPEHAFIFLSDVEVPVVAGENVSFKMIGKKANGFFSLNRWLNRSVKQALKKLKADVFVSLDGSACTTKTISQIIGVTDLKFLDRGSFLNKLLVHNRFKKALIKATSIITVSEAVKQELSLRFIVPKEKIFIAPKAPKTIFKPADWQQRENVKEEFAEGKEYFLFTGGFDANRNLLNVLKAFSHFKKWQQSEMKLVVAGDTSNDTTGMMQKLETYKFKDDVVITGKMEPVRFSLLLASAYALIYTSLVETFGMPVLEAMRSGTPVIVSKTSAVSEITGDAVLFADANDAENISQQMILLYKDEDLRNELIKRGLQQSEKFNWKDSADVLWQLIKQAT